MRSKRTLDAPGYAEAQEDAVEPSRANCTCANCTYTSRTCASRTCASRACAKCVCSDRACSNCAGIDRACCSRVRIVRAGQHAHHRRNEERPIGCDGQALIGAVGENHELPQTHLG